MANPFYIIDSFVTTAAGDPFRLFPFGTITKEGKARELTRELAAMFKLPHFRPPIKLGSHKDETPAAGHIVALEVRDDGLWAVPEWNEEGLAALEKGAFRYQSPEVIWEGWIEDALSGKKIEGPLIMGAALLHTPALGHATAFYSVEHGEDTMSEERTYEVPASVWERLWANLFDRPADPAPEPEPPQAPAVPEDYEALQAQAAKADEYRAEIEKMQAEQARADRVAHFAAAVEEHPALADDEETHELLADLPEETAEKVLVKFRALAAQIDESKLTTDIGKEGEPEGVDSYAIFQAAIDKKMKDGMGYTAALSAVAKEQPDLVQEVTGR